MAMESAYPVRAFAGWAVRQAADAAVELSRRFEQAREQTFWGPGRRLLPPVRFTGGDSVPRLTWDVPAGPLGAAAPQW